jgi:hypothetical protein
MSEKEPEQPGASRREFLTRTGSGLAALSALAAGCSESTPPVASTATPAPEPAAAVPVPKPRSQTAPQAPYDSIRD